ncbi:15424_t:CDS:1, partial [Gigaspora rosea]
ILWSLLLIVRESPNIRIYKYYTATIAPLLLGAIIAAILIGVHITPTVALPWAGVGVICSNLARDFFALIIEA